MALISSYFFKLYWYNSITLLNLKTSMDNEHHDKLTSDLPAPKQSRALKAIVIVAVLAAIFFGLSKLPKNKISDNNVTTNTAIGLSADEKSALEAKAKELQDKIAGFASDIDPIDKLAAYLELAETQEKLGLYPDAIETLSEVPPENQNNPRLWITYAAVYRGSGDLVKARENSRRALDLNIKNPNAWKEHIADSADQGDDAINSLYAQAVNHTENDIGLVIDYARFLERIGKKDAAIYYWEKAIQVDTVHKVEYEAEITRLKQ